MNTSNLDANQNNNTHYSCINSKNNSIDNNALEDLNRVELMLEFNPNELLKFNIEILDKLIRPINEELIVITVIGSSNSNQIDLANSIIKLNKYNKANDDYNSNTDNINNFNNSKFTSDKPGLWVYINGISNNNKNNRFIVINCQGLEHSEFKYTDKLYFMLHSLSSVLIFNTNRPTLTDLSIMSNMPSCITGTSNPEDLILEMSPKIIYVLNKYNNEEENSSYYSHLPIIADDSNALLDYLEKEDELRDYFTSFYKERKAFIISNVSNNKTEVYNSIKKIILTNSFGKTYKGVRNDGETLRGLLIEFVNNINRNIAFNINKM